MSNARLIKNQNSEPILINKREILETNEDGLAYLHHKPFENLFVYDFKTGEKLNDFTIEGNVIRCPRSFQELIVDYSYNYDGSSTLLQIGEALTQGYLSLQGKMRVKDDITGQVKTGILMIPKLKLMSDLSMRLGTNATPQVGKLDAIALPVGVKGNKKVMEIIFLDDDINFSSYQ
jgi:hypothetical protein